MAHSCADDQPRQRAEATSVHGKSIIRIDPFSSRIESGGQAASRSGSIKDPPGARVAHAPVASTPGPGSASNTYKSPVLGRHRSADGSPVHF